LDGTSNEVAVTYPDIDTLGTVGSALQDYSPVIDATTDRPAAGANVAYANAAALTHLALRVFARVNWAGTLAPSLITRDEGWNNGLNSVPTLVRTGVGTGTLTYPATVADEIPAGLPGYNAAGHAVNLRAGWANSENASTQYQIEVAATSPNVLTFYIWNQSGSLADPNPTIFSLFGL
jgi:hypothetical protein